MLNGNITSALSKRKSISVIIRISCFYSHIQWLLNKEWVFKYLTEWQRVTNTIAEHIENCLKHKTVFEANACIFAFLRQ